MSDDWNEWERITPDSAVARLLPLREQMAEVCKSYEHAADPDALVTAEVIQCQNPDHLCALLWDKSIGVCRGVLTGDFTTGPAGESLFRVGWVHFIALDYMEPSPKSNKCLLDEYLKLFGVQAVVIESARPPRVIARWDRQFSEVARVYRREVA